MATQLKSSQSVAPQKSRSGIGSSLALAYGVACYLILLGVIVYLIGFVENIGVPTSVDSGWSSSTLEAVLFDLGLLGLFAAQHSIMARPRFKSWWTRIIPASIERSTFVLLTNLVFILCFWQWHALPALVWQVSDPTVQALLIGLSLFGWLIVLISTVLISHFDLFGLRQVYLAWRHKAYTDLPFRIVGLYRLIRHPMMLGFLIAFWATPRMTAGHLLFALTTTAYIVLAVRFLEERDLVSSFGDTYRAYRRRVPMLVPLPRLRKQ